MLHEDGQRALTTCEPDHNVIQLVAEVDNLIAGKTRAVSESLERLGGAVEASLRESVRGGLFLCGNRPRLEQCVRLGKLRIEFGLRCPKRVDLRAQRLGPAFEIFGSFGRFLEDLGRITSGARLRRADAHEGVELALCFVSVAACLAASARR